MPLNAQQLGQLIFDANPYSTNITVDDAVEQQLDVGWWRFKGGVEYVEKALKICYTYVDTSGVTIKDYILIGYEGGGGY